MKKPGAGAGLRVEKGETVRTGRAGPVPRAAASFGGHGIGRVPAGLLD